MFLLFCWLFCILVVAAFADIVAGTFMGFTVTDGVQSANIIANGAVATTSVMFIVFAVALGLPSDIVYTLITLSISAFALTSLDSVARVGRLSFQELFLDDSISDENMGKVRKVLTNKYFATIITLVLAYGLTLVGYKNIWALFGTSNQLLSVFAFLA